MALKVEIDPKNPNVQRYGTYTYDMELGSGQYILRRQSARKWFPDLLSKTRTETCIKEAIKNYKAELKAR